MADDDLTLESVLKMAADIGMTHFDNEHLQQLLRDPYRPRAARHAAGCEPHSSRRARAYIQSRFEG